MNSQVIHSEDFQWAQCWFYFVVLIVVTAKLMPSFSSSDVTSWKRFDEWAQADSDGTEYDLI